MKNASQSERRNPMIAAWGAVAVTAYGLLAALQIAVLNPLAAVPGAGLQEIYAETAAAGQPMGAWWLVMGIGPLVATGVLRRTWRRPGLEPSRVARVYLILLALGAPAYFFASFSPGMSLADTYLISGGDHSPWAWPLYLVSVVAAVALAIQVARRHLHLPRGGAVQGTA